MLLIQVCAAALVTAYFQLPNFQAFVARIGEAKVAGGVFFAFSAGMIAGGVLPEIARWVTRRPRNESRHWSKVAWAGVVYGIVGIQIERLYYWQEQWFGSGTDIGTLLTKTAVDMVLFSPFISILTAATLFSWWREYFRVSALKRVPTWAFFRDEVLAVMPLCWAFWIPIVFGTYALPQDLQFPFSVLAEAAWSILFVFIATNTKEAEKTVPTVLA